MSRFAKNKKELLILAKAKPALAKQLLCGADKSIITDICELILNVLNGNIRLSPNKKDRLSRYKSPMRRLVKNGESWKSKRTQLQKGGFIGTLLGVALPLAIQGISALVKSIKRKKAARKGRARRP